MRSPTPKTSTILRQRRASHEAARAGDRGGDPLWVSARGADNGEGDTALPERLGAAAEDMVVLIGECVADERTEHTVSSTLVFHGWIARRPTATHPQWKVDEQIQG